jgi:hypothetical protein
MAGWDASISTGLIVVLIPYYWGIVTIVDGTSFREACHPANISLTIHDKLHRLNIKSAGQRIKDGDFNINDWTKMRHVGASCGDMIPFIGLMAMSLLFTAH